MIFGSVSQREHEHGPAAAKKDGMMNSSQMSNPSGRLASIPPVQIQNLNRPPAAQYIGTNNSSSGENFSMPPSDSEKLAEHNIMKSSLNYQPSHAPYQRSTLTAAPNSVPKVKTPEPKLWIPNGLNTTIAGSASNATNGSATGNGALKIGRSPGGSSSSIYKAKYNH